ncbi:amidohydrolase family protein [Streptomyces sp. NPDC051546]|uniref:amidohydrolase family protein n=1 Tax=Streptomyces sp. NPDC051546 TaxID=3365655 RepID=UPI003790C024
MDENGVTMQVLSLAPPGVQMQPDAAIAVADAQRANDALAAVVAAHPTRFGGLAALPLQDPAAAVREAGRAMRELGMAGFLVNGHTCGPYLDEQAVGFLRNANLPNSQIRKIAHRNAERILRL